MNTEDRPLISVITVVFNGERYLETAIRSVIDQDYDNVEYIIIDGGSIDSTLDIINRYDEEIDCWISEADDGIYDAWNKGLREANGEWVCFLGADDVLLKDALSNYVNVIREFNLSESCKYISSKVDFVDGEKVVREIGEPWVWRKFKRYMCVAHVGSLHHFSLYDEYGVYDKNYQICGDYELLLRPSKALKTFFLDKKTVRMNSGGISNKLVYKAFAETKNAKLKNKARSVFWSEIDRQISVFKYLINRVLAHIKSP